MPSRSRRSRRWPGCRQFFADPAFEAESEALQRIESIAWQGYDQARKSPIKRKAGPGFADPNYELPIEWHDTRERLLKAEARQKDPATPSRVLMSAWTNKPTA